MFLENKGQWPAEARFRLDGPNANYWIAPDGIAIDYREATSTQEITDDGTLRVRENGARGHVVRVRLEGATGQSVSRGLQPLEPVFHFMNGPVHAQNVRTFAEVRTENLRPGVSARYYLQGETPRYDLILAPGVDPSTVRLRYEGAENLRVAADGGLVYETSLGVKREAGLFTYQVVNGQKRAVASRFVVNGDRVGFELGQFDRSRPVVIDPQLLTQSRYFGGSGLESINDASFMPGGNIVVSGGTTSTASTFPTTAGAYATDRSGTGDVFVAVFRPDFSLRFMTYIGNDSGLSNVENNASTRVIGGDNVTLLFQSAAGTSVNLPVNISANNGTTINLQNNGYDQIYNGQEIYICKLRPDLGQIRFATLHGSGSAAGLDINNDTLHAAAVDNNGFVYVALETFSTNTSRTILSGYGSSRLGTSDGHVARIRPRLDALKDGTYMGANGQDRALNVFPREDGSVYVAGTTQGANGQQMMHERAGLPFTGTGAGWDMRINNSTLNSNNTTGFDAFVVRLRPNFTVGNGTYFGGNLTDRAFNMTRTATGLLISGVSSGTGDLYGPTNALLPITGFDKTSSTTSGGGDEGWIARFDFDLRRLGAVTYIGGATGDSAGRMAALPNGQILALGTSSATTVVFDGTGTQTGLPVTADALPSGSGTDIVLYRLNPSLQLISGSKFGGAGTDNPGPILPFGPYNDAFITGSTSSSDFPNATNAIAGAQDAFLARVAFTRDPVEMRLGQTTINAGQFQIFGNVWLNGPAPSPSGMLITLTSSDPRITIFPDTVTVAAGSRLSPQFKMYRSGTFRT